MAEESFWPAALTKGTGNKVVVDVQQSGISLIRNRIFRRAVEAPVQDPVLIRLKFVFDGCYVSSRTSARVRRLKAPPP